MIRAEVVGGETHELALDEGATYADLLAALGLNRHEATVLVDGRPVPDDERVESESVQVLRLIKGG